MTPPSVHQSPPPTPVMTSGDILSWSSSGYSNEAQKPVSAKSEDKIEVDIGPGTWQEIYRGILATQIRMVKTFSLSTTMLGLMMQPIIVQKAAETSFGIVVAMGSFIGFFTFVTPLLIHWITKKYVTRLEYDHEKDLYSATTLSFFLREKKIHFKVQDIHVPAVPGMFTTFLAKNKPLFVDPKMFSDLEHPAGSWSCRLISDLMKSVL
ncbi:transmembrane protein 70 homolog, mitochondrial-like [Penaeus japonicus]|uniref:transmembrane protein 70 homolog, mitochondrial-like n=1 Tax=Penaeus japonicus TaxID=27405 RepID=UPI001C7126BE|nr:transmembrane protein 70 homolog, mitochondrial-like [Penaeus japonicus]